MKLRLWAGFREEETWEAVVDGNNADKALFNKAETIRSEYVVAVKGVVAARTEGNVNKNM